MRYYLDPHVDLQAFLKEFRVWRFGLKQLKIIYSIGLKMSIFCLCIDHAPTTNIIFCTRFQKIPYVSQKVQPCFASLRFGRNIYSLFMPKVYPVWKTQGGYAILYVRMVAVNISFFLWTQGLPESRHGFTKRFKWQQQLDNFLIKEPQSPFEREEANRCFLTDTIISSVATREQVMWKL